MQETQLFHDSIANNIAIGKENASREEIIEAAKKASIHEFISTLPKGYDTEVGELGDTLSGGEKQRIGIARAFLHDAPFLLMDEPFAALDHFTRTQLQKELIRLQKSQNTGILFVTHSIDEALLLGHKIAFLEDGCIKKEFLLDTDCENRDLLSKELIELKREILAQLHL